LRRGESAEIDLIRSGQQLFIPFVVLAEVRASFLAGSRPGLLWWRPGAPVPDGD
jgi:hypothetical protein